MFFNQGCPADFVFPAMAVVEIDSSIVVDGITKEEVTQDENEFLYFVTVLQNGIAAQVSPLFARAKRAQERARAAQRPPRRKPPSLLELQ
jgi:hypothetical protein